MTDRISRFSRAERAVHWAIAVLMLSCVTTAAVLYNGELAIKVGHRRTVELIHIYSGIGLVLALLIGALSPAFRRDVARLNRLTRHDWRWLRTRSRRDGRIPVGKFNAGQKVNSALSTGAILVLAGTGLILWFPDHVRVSWRTSATFVHDWFALGLGLLVIGHAVFALGDAEAMRGALRGHVSRAWARREHREWLDEVDATD